MTCGIYKITNKVNGKCYIGQSINIETRWHHHKYFQKTISHYPLYRAIAKYGIDNFQLEIIEKCSKQELDSKEIYYIKYYDSYKNGYNQTLGGGGSSGCIIKISNEDLIIIYDLLLNSNTPQKEIAYMFNVGEDTISEINQGKTRIQEGYSYPLRQNKKISKYCIDCGKEISSTAIRCIECEHKKQRVVERPSRKELKQLIRTMPFTTIGKKFGVSDNSIRKWCILENLPSKAKEIKMFSDDEWKKI